MSFSKANGFNKILEEVKMTFGALDRPESVPETAFRIEFLPCAVRWECWHATSCVSTKGYLSRGLSNGVAFSWSEGRLRETESV
jgi:hypothetical protein